jgi:hypothetical protein
VSTKFVSSTPEAGLSRRGLRRLSRWALLVTLSLAVLLAGVLLLGVWWLASSQTTSADYYTAPEARTGIEVHVQSGDVTIVGGSTVGVFVSRIDHSVFGHGPHERLAVHGGILHLVSSCPALVVGSCASSYRLIVPYDVPISVRAEHGTISLDVYRGSADIATDNGAISVEGYCGSVLGAASSSGDVSVSTACPPKRLVLRSDSGNISATVTAGDYQIDAASTTGSAYVHGLVNDNGAPWAIEALSNSGNVTVGSAG